MILLAVAFLVSLLPPIGLFLWLRQVEGDAEFKGICNRALLQGAITALPVAGCSMLFVIAEYGLSRIGLSGISKVAYHEIIAIALAEELCKYLMFRQLLKKYDRAWSWADYIILMTIVGIGFGILEDFFYIAGSDAITMIVRGVTCMHGGYGFIMGYFLGKGQKTGNKGWTVAGLALPWLLHGAYDFGLSEEFLALSDNAAFLPVSLAIFALVTLVAMIVLFIRHKNDERYMAPMAPMPEAGQAPESTMAVEIKLATETA